MDGDLFKVASEKDSNLDISLKVTFKSSPVTNGGPDLPEEYTIIHGFGEVEGATKLCPGVFEGGGEELMHCARAEHFDPRQALFVKGCLTWEPGELSEVISKGLWYPAAVSQDFILRHAGAPVTADDNPDDLWSDILTCMGGWYAEIARVHAGKGDLCVS